MTIQLLLPTPSSKRPEVSISTFGIKIFFLDHSEMPHLIPLKMSTIFKGKKKTKCSQGCAEIRILVQLLCVHAESLQSSLCNAMDCSLPGFSVSMDSGQEYWTGLPCPHPRELPNPEIEPASLKSPALAGGFLPEVLRAGVSWWLTW